MKRLLIASTLFLLSSVGHVLACDGIAVERTNPSTGNVERVCPVWDGHDYEIFWYEKVDDTWSSGTQLTDDAADDVAPHLAFDGSGGTGVVWRKSGSNGRVWYRGRKLVSGEHAWQSAVVAVSDADHDASAPWITFHGSTPRVAWHEYASGSDTRVVTAEGDGGDPWPTAFSSDLLATTSYDEDLMLEIRSKNGALWVVWVNSDSYLGYSEWNSDDQSWSAASYEAYDGPGDIGAGKQRIEDRVTR